MRTDNLFEELYPLEIQSPALKPDDLLSYKGGLSLDCTASESVWIRRNNSPFDEKWSLTQRIWSYEEGKHRKNRKLSFVCYLGHDCEDKENFTGRSATSELHPPFSIKTGLLTSQVRFISAHADLLHKLTCFSIYFKLLISS